ncbi:MAG: peptide chain release factor N(5)-glutamine methyltransferase [Gammaproteobacteria bacterium]|nr:peptide chain release factor N(5)-glutamine methyltransferase [Gammaproteobacteria bacterium]
MKPVRTVLAEACARWPAGAERARIQPEIWQLACHVLQWPLERLLAHGDTPLDETAVSRLEHLAARRRAGEPLAYLTGETEFWSLPLCVSPAVLVPRPETEILIEQALARMPAGCVARVLDLGTGSGAIALALQRERPHAQIVAVDRQAPALAVAARNARRHGLPVTFLQGHWAAAIAGRSVDMVVSNPPYIEHGDPCLAEAGLCHEPRTALAGGADGLRDLRAVIADAARVLVGGGWLLMEHGNQQGAAVRALLAQAGFGEIGTHKDYAGWERVSGGRHG